MSVDSFSGLYPIDSISESNNGVVGSGVVPTSRSIYKGSIVGSNASLTSMNTNNTGIASSGREAKRGVSAKKLCAIVIYAFKSDIMNTVYFMNRGASVVKFTL